MQLAEQEKEKDTNGKENKEPRERYKKRGTGNYLNEKEKDSNYNTNQHSEDEEPFEGDSENRPNYQSNYKKKRQISQLGYDYEDDVWNLATGDAEISERKNSHNYAAVEKSGTTKPKKIIRKEKPEERRMSENTLEPGKDKVVISVGPAKSIKDIFG
jgi:hypothetical protein